MSIIGGLGTGGLGFVSAYLISEKNSINASVRFYVDTGASKTTISDVDAERVGINYNKLNKSKTFLIGIGAKTHPYVLEDCALSFDFGRSAIIEYVGEIFVLEHIDNIERPSLLGLDVLKYYSIHFEPNGIRLQKRG